MRVWYVDAKDEINGWEIEDGIGGLGVKRKAR